jgi:hypothetical protein
VVASSTGRPPPSRGSAPAPVGRHRRRRLVTAGLLLGAAALAGCGSEGQGKASTSPATSPASAPESNASGSSAATSTGAVDDLADLSAGLLPAEAFGPGAQATPIPADQVERGQTQLGALGLAGLTISPDGCAPALTSLQPGLGDLTGLGAQSVTVGSTRTAEVLAAGNGVTAAVDQLAATPHTCPQATLSAPQIGTAHVTFAALDVPAVGDGSAGLVMTLSLTGPDGRPVPVPVLLAMARDGGRLVSLTAVDLSGTADPAAFAALLPQAFARQADALD